ncbi:MAG: hypothetical protein CVV33_06350, partial [Methanomicrobiales archaeon HGW-Methanomicrobiales-4]
LKAPDLLDIVPYTCHKPANGDVICYTPPDEDKYIVHRIIRITPSGIRTQGDNNNIPDNYDVPDDLIIGQVIGAMRGRTYRKISSGWSGRITRRMVEERKKILFGGYQMFLRVSPYIRITQSFLPFFSTCLNPRIFLYTSPQMFTLKLFYLSWVIGEYNSERGVWTIRFPFRYMIHVTDLPTVEPSTR